MSLSVSDVLGEQGALAKFIEGYRARPSQIELAEQIFETILRQGSYVAEAPTGIGKTFAYLVPALLSDKKVVISTGTKNLQDQLFSRDLPILLKALKKPLKTALLKGRQNYVCHYRIDYNLANGWFPTTKIQSEFKRIHKNLLRFTTGDRSEFPEIAEDSEAWTYTTSTADNCLSKDCPFLKECFVSKARNKAQQADLVVINHHLFFADCALKEEGFGEILPAVDVVVFDEAHQLAHVATSFFGNRLSSRQFKVIIDELSEEQKKHTNDDAVLLQHQQSLIEKSDVLREAFDVPNGRYPWQEFKKKQTVKTVFDELKDTLEITLAHIKAVLERSPGYKVLSDRLSEMLTFIDNVTGDLSKNTAIYWVELFKSSLIINETPLSIAEVFQSIILANTSYIYTSATLSVNGNFNYFSSNLGLDALPAHSFDTPFDYPEQSMMYLPRGLPDPSDEQYIARLVAQTLPVIKAFGGRTFFLFTSFKALHKAEELLKSESDFSLFVQGDMGKMQLVDSFCKTDNAVLLGTSSFWEGMDVRGDALSCVIIDKLPFESPFDPIVQARIKQLKKQGVAAFDHYQLPIAVIALKQGLGRLIRDAKDKGVLIVGDPRLYGRAYGESFFKSLPEMVVTRDRQLVLEFIDTIPFTKTHENVIND